MIPARDFLAERLNLSKTTTRSILYYAISRTQTESNHKAKLIRLFFRRSCEAQRSPTRHLFSCTGRRHPQCCTIFLLLSRFHAYSHTSTSQRSPPGKAANWTGG